MACGHFNRAAFDGSSSEELRRKLKAILKPDGVHQYEGSASHKYPFPDVITVEAPFIAEYGNNLTFGKQCRIASGCTFKDPRDIIVGDYCRIGAGVTISGVSDSDPKDHHEWQYGATIRIGQFVAIGAHTVVTANRYPVFIGDNVTIGPGCTISSWGRKLTIGKDATIAPGCVITDVGAKSPKDRLFRH
jgi:acetyltransferase-like isoleucine patch superfamily enzyme